MSRVGIVTGMPFERDIVLGVGRRCGWGEVAPLVEASGVGGGSVDAVLDRMAGSGISGIISFGIAGGLELGLEPGSIVLPETVLAGDGTSFLTDAGWHGRLREQLGASASGPVVSTSEIAQSRQAKEALRAQYQAVAVDMELAVIARWSEEADLPFAVIRAVSDPADFSLPPAVVSSTRTGHFDLGRLMLDVAGHPTQIPGLIRLGQHTRRARKTLAAVCEKLGPGFAL